MGNKRLNVLVHTGGTFSMGYDRSGALVPLYDMRHSLLAMKILDLEWDKNQQKVLLTQLVHTRELLLAIREGGRSSGALEEQLEDELDAIAAEIGIITGGEISLASITQEYGIHPQNRMPYNIDGIDFSIRQHYPLLKKEIFAILAEGHTPIITLGSDTAEFVGPLLANDLARHRQLDGHTVILVSSMISFQQDPAHGGRLLQAAMELATHKIPGAFALSARDQHAEKIDVHDLLDGFKKVSNQPDAFRSREPVGTLTREGGFARSNMGYMPLSRQIPLSDHDGLAYVAPPLLLGKTLLGAIHYLRALPNLHAVLEVTDRIAFEPEEQQHLLHLVRERVGRGIATILIDPLTYDKASGRMTVDNDLWRESAFVKAFSRVGGIVRVGQQASETYLEAVLSLGAVELLEATDRLRRAYGIGLPEEIMPSDGPLNPQAQTLTLRYIPDPDMFIHALETADGFAEKIILEGMPGGVLPARHVKALEEVVAHGHVLEFHDSASIAPEELPAGSKDRRLYAASKAFMDFMEGLASGLQEHCLKVH
jgi:hypothetical protein